MDLYNCCSDGVKWGWFFFCNILSFYWHLLHSYHCLERPSQVSIYFVYCCSERPSQVKRVFSSFLATFSILFFRSNIFPLFQCTYLKIVVWLDKIKWSVFFSVCLFGEICWALVKTLPSQMGSFQMSSTRSTEFNRPEPISINLNQFHCPPLLV